MIAIAKKDAGVTLIELMIVLVIAAFLVAGVYSLFITQHRSYSVQDQVVGVQQDARAALNIMARDIRMAGFVVGAGSALGFTDGTSNVVMNGFRYAVNPTNFANAPDTLTVVLGVQELGAVNTVIDSAVSGEYIVTLKDIPTGFDPSVYFDAAPKNFVAFELSPARVYNVISSTSTSINVQQVPSDLLIEGGMAYGVKAITYLVTPDGVLRRNENTGLGAQPLVGDGVTTFVEDLQFAYQLQGAGSWNNLTGGDAGIRMVRINISVRTAVQDPVVQDADPAARFDQPALEDHTINLSTNDGFRRRVYTTEVKVRNL